MNMIFHFLKKYIHDDEKKLALKISIASFFIFVTILALIIGASYIYQRNGAYREFVSENKFIENREILPDIIRNSTFSIPSPPNRERHRGPRDLIIFDTNKQVLKNDFLDLTTENIDFLFSLSKTENKSIEFAEHTYLISRNDIGEYTIFLFRDLTPLRDFHITLLLIALAWSLVTLVIIFLLSQYLAHITIGPIREQARELESYSHNVAHELRTPLSVIRSNLELLRLKPEARFIDSTDEEIMGMERIIESLLFLAKPTGAQTIRDLDMIKKTQEIVDKYNPENLITYTYNKKYIRKKMSSELYTRILCNLIENAIKYKSEGHISIDLSKESVKISNSITQGISQEEQNNLTKAFYQWDASRNSTGYGLGLALVAKIVDISEWTMNITVKNKKFIVEIYF